MPAGIVKALQDPCVVTYQQYLLVAQRERLKRARARKVARTADINPVAVPDPLQLSFILPRVEIRLRRQAQCEISKPVVANVIATRCTQHVPSPTVDFRRCPSHYSASGWSVYLIV